MIKIGVIFPVLFSEELVPTAVAEYRHAAAPSTGLIFYTLTRGTQTIENETELALNVPGVITAATQAAADGVDAVGIGCTGDPAILAVKEVLSVPVVGEGEASLHQARVVSSRFSSITPGERTVPLLRRFGDASPFARKIASVRAIDADVLSMGDNCLGEIIAESVAAVTEDKTEAILMGCTGTGDNLAAAVATGLERELGFYVPVVDPVHAAIGAAEWLLAS